MSETSTAVALARELIAVESITGNEEPVVRILERELGAMGFAVRRDEVAPGRHNLYAGPARPAVLFSTHTDTVPPFLEAREDETHLHGRGACDTKGIQACMIEAGQRLLAANFKDFGYLFVVGEEVDNCGARAANEHVRAGHVILGEPTENQIAVGHKGVYGCRIQARGVAAHSAYPELGDSAIHRLLRGIQRVLAADFGISEILGPATVNVGEIQGGVAPNVFAPQAAATLVVRVVGPLEDIERKVAECFADPDTGEADPHIEIEGRSRMPVPHLERVEDFPETTVSFGTDAPFMGDVGKIVLFGPGNIQDAHTDHEKIAKADMAVAVERYMELAKRLAAS
jgi:acetylornithine deacetylase